MTFIESLVTGLFVFVMVFLVLLLLFVFIRLFSYVINKLIVNNSSSLKAAATIAPDSQSLPLSAGELKLINVDEQTAALIMAIVSDESDIPLSQLCFKSIRLIENKE